MGGVLYLLCSYKTLNLIVQLQQEVYNNDITVKTTDYVKFLYLQTELTISVELKSHPMIMDLYCW